MSDPSANEPSGPPPSEQLSDAERADRMRRGDRATRGVLAAVLALEALVTLLVPRALAFTSGGVGVIRTVVLIVFAVVLVVAAGMVRRPYGIGLGSALQLLFLLTGIWLLAMLVVGAIFAAVWARVLILRRDLLGGSTGWRLLYS